MSPAGPADVGTLAAVTVLARLWDRGQGGEGEVGTLPLPRGQQGSPATSPPPTGSALGDSWDPQDLGDQLREERPEGGEGGPQCTPSRVPAKLGSGPHGPASGLRPSRRLQNGVGRPGGGHCPQGQTDVRGTDRADLLRQAGHRALRTQGHPWQRGPHPLPGPTRSFWKSAFLAGECGVQGAGRMETGPRAGTRQ